MEERKEWVDDVFYDTEKGQLNYLLLKEFYENHKKNINDFSIIKINESEIEKCVIERTNKLNYELDEKNNEIIDLEDDKDELQTEYNTLSEENRSLKDSRDEEIKKEVEIRLDGKNEIIEHQREQIGLLRGELVDKQIIETKLSDLTENINQHKSSYEKGKVGEAKSLPILQRGTWEKVVDTHGTPHQGDAWLYISDKIIITDTKDHTWPVPAEDVRNLARDIKGNQCHGGVIISFKSGIYDPTSGKEHPNGNYITCVEGQQILLLSKVESLPEEYINSIILCFYHQISDDSMENEEINIKMIMSIAKSIFDMEAEIKSEKTAHERRIINKENQMKQLKLTLEKALGTDFEDYRPEGNNSKKKNLTKKQMCEELLGFGCQQEELKGLNKEQVGKKYNEIVS